MPASQFIMLSFSYKAVKKSNLNLFIRIYIYNFFL
ncbi:hypothetical protein EaACW_2981 [Erwinia amylovora ACW56400]|uniref:Uncharacterized protein n=2 Tax=Erwinia amylovora TaxID=552 RepID=A0A831A781_ERWAM|nr:hypothetical protein EaACW_2981 [Erwinia amylovora ACW56400]CBX81840.1 hypothetical protein predicted by Glimmer/Critica [Erwinia amylovora ATCC BAA-2158]CCO79823.1 hypothetical protein BN432_3044 [Erwinia amylovora Ea356]CCO83627.1 hypothetical protein BN433_3070 [Erwinia amylovora Ea266]CCO87385.1 hypothetical protein BN434_3015 [Erwinia amylovora CFBP 2585]CCO91183.1 hypothetical protein BN435_3031 [Erwinia amylovora 01SFR-BO]CCO94967.1 hypothetical protein BN437_3057 [Erwinia amylovora